jgi:hypothetical protein
VSDHEIQREALIGRRPLPAGAYSEIELRAIEICWKGKVDLLVLSPERCEISDFKTGAHDEGHRFQILVYALLWSRDRELNPDGPRADRLVLRYNAEDVEVAAPTNPELYDLESQLTARREAAVQAISQIPPEARPDAETCRYCAVRQLCSNYWTAGVQLRLVEQTSSSDRRIADIEVTITGRHGPASWDAVVELPTVVRAGKLALLRTSGNIEFRSGDRVRVLDATVTVGSAEQLLLITLNTLSETYIVN